MKLTANTRGLLLSYCLSICFGFISFYKDVQDDKDVKVRGWPVYELIGWHWNVSVSYHLVGLSQPKPRNQMWLCLLVPWKLWTVCTHLNKSVCTGKTTSINRVCYYNDVVLKCWTTKRPTPPLNTTNKWSVYWNIRVSESLETLSTDEKRPLNELIVLVHTVTTHGRIVLILLVGLTHVNLIWNCNKTHMLRHSILSSMTTVL